VDVTALKDNTRALKGFAGERCLLMAMVKANGYGHGMVTAAQAALTGGADWLGVSSITEGLQLRDAGLKVPILNVGWTPTDDIGVAARGDIDIAVFSRDAVDAADAAGRRLGRSVRVHWKLDTGMGRLGTPPGLAREMSRALHGAAHVTVCGLFTHFASADAEGLEATHRQHERFIELVTQGSLQFADALLHCANSAATLRLRETHHDLTRPGIALYGYPPPHCEGVVSLRPAMTVKTMVSQIKRVAAGETVGYGSAWTAPIDTLVAMLAAGYADGVDRRNGNQGQVLVKGVACPIVGRVSMDQAAVDVSAVDGVLCGTEVTLLGPSSPGTVDAAAVAHRIGTIPNEVLCAVSARVPRVSVTCPA
jgi:alanine racemase